MSIRAEILRGLKKAAAFRLMHGPEQFLCLLAIDFDEMIGRLESVRDKEGRAKMPVADIVEAIVVRADMASKEFAETFHEGGGIALAKILQVMHRRIAKNGDYFLKTAIYETMSSISPKFINDPVRQEFSLLKRNHPVLAGVR